MTRLFADVLRELDRGKVHQQASSEFQKLVQAVAESGKPGSFTLKLSLKPQGAGSDALAVAAAIQSKEPAPDQPATLFFVTDEFDLSRRDPRQMDLDDFTTVDGPGPVERSR